MIRLSENQFDIVMQAARALPSEKREAFAVRVEGLLKLRSGRPSDSEIAAIVQQALSGLVQQVA